MYYPYFRGKLYELVLLREQASFLANNHIHPIIEPVRDPDSLKSVVKEFVKRGVAANFPQLRRSWNRSVGSIQALVK